MFHQQHSAPFQIGSNHSRQSNPNSWPTSNRIIINYTSKIFPFPYAYSRRGFSSRFLNRFVPTPARRQPLVSRVTMCTSRENRASLPVGAGEKRRRKKVGTRDECHSRREQSLFLFFFDQQFRLQYRSPLIVFLLTKEHRNCICDVILIYYESERRGWLFVSADDRGFSLLDSLSGSICIGVSKRNCMNRLRSICCSCNTKY